MQGNVIIRHLGPRFFIEGKKFIFRFLFNQSLKGAIRITVTISNLSLSKSHPVPHLQLS